MVMFFGMTFCFPLHSLKMRRDRRALLKAERQPLLAGTSNDVAHAPIPERSVHKDHHRRVYLAVFPAMADLIGTALTMTGLLYTTVSVNQMLRGAELVFCAMLSIVFLKRTLDRNNWTGLFLCVVGISLVGLASTLNAHEDDEESQAKQAKEWMGFALIVSAQAVQASQIVIEEFLLQEIEMEPLEIVGWEGVYGTVISCLVALPIVNFIPGTDCGSFENSWDSVLMIAHSVPLILVEILDTVGMLLYNYFAMCVTQDLSAMHRTVLETLRTLFAWVIDLMLFYIFTNGSLGEPWDRGSWVQLLGFTILVTGTVVYNRSEYEADDMAEKVALLNGGGAQTGTTSYDSIDAAAKPRAINDSTTPLTIAVSSVPRSTISTAAANTSDGAAARRAQEQQNQQQLPAEVSGRSYAGSLKVPAYGASLRRGDSFSAGGAMYSSSLKRVSTFSPR